MSHSYTPEISDYKEATITNIVTSNGSSFVTLQLKSSFIAQNLPRAKMGWEPKLRLYNNLEERKFDMEEECDDTDQEFITVNWSTLIEVKFLTVIAPQ